MRGNLRVEWKQVATLSPGTATRQDPHPMTTDSQTLLCLLFSQPSSVVALFAHPTKGSPPSSHDLSPLSSGKPG